jgi:uncharacterized OB-fold protein
MTLDAHLPFDEQLTTLHPDRWTRPFWDAAAEHRLVGHQCAACGAFRHPPGPFCWQCRSREARWVDLPGTGTVYSFTVVRHPMTPAAKDAVPYVVALVALDGAPGVRLITNLVGVEPGAVRIGLPVRVVWDDLRPGTTVPRFAPFDA